MTDASINPQTVRRLLKNSGIRPRRKLGQNFLADSNVARKIVRLVTPSARDVFLEIGAGVGALTLPLAESGAKVFAVEVDANLTPLLRRVVGAFQNVDIVEQDILRVDMAELASNAGVSRVSVLGNLPYNITTQVILYLLENRLQIDRALITVQREYAERLRARPGGREYGSITVMAQFRCEISHAMTVSSSCFFPEPEVDSTVLDLRVRSEPAVRVKDEAAFERVVRAAFSHRRKMLLNSLAESTGLDKTEVAHLLESAGVEGTWRAERLGLEELGRIADVFYDEGRFAGEQTD